MARTTLYLGTDQGALTVRSSNGSWEVESQGVKEWSVQEVAVDPSAPDRVLAATRGDGVWVSEDGGKAWKKPCYGRPGPGKTRCITFDPGDSRRVFVGGEPIEVYVSDNLGASWERLDSVRKLPFIEKVDYPVPTVEPHVRDIAIDPQDSNTIYAALQVGGMIKSTDGGATWTHIEKELDCDVHTIVVDADHTNVLVIATGGHDSRSGKVKGRALYRSADGGQSWSPVAMQFTQEYSVPLVPNPQNPHVLYSGLANGTPNNWHRPSGAEAVLIRSSDGGRNWERLDTGLPELEREFARAIAVHPTDSNRIYAGVTGGIITSADAGATWSRLDLKLPAINDMKCVAE